MKRRRKTNTRHRIKKVSKNSRSKPRMKSTGRLSRQRKMNILFRAVVIVIVVFIVFCIRNLFLYIVETDITPENPYPVKGVDVSSYQLDIDWQGLEDEGFKFAFIKATEGSGHVDNRFEYNWKEANQTDMKVGAYHFLSYDTEGETQAQNYIDTVNKKWGMLPPIVDVEFYGKYEQNHPGKDKVKQILDVVLNKLEKKYHRKPIIYTNLYIYQEYISGEYDDYPIWISAHNIPEKLYDGRDWTFCQYTFYGKSESISNGEKYVDMNVFNGSSWDFRKYNGK